MRRSLLLGVVPCLVFAAALTSAREAHAGPYLGIDLDLGTAFQDNVDFAYGLGGRFGYKIYFAGAPVWLLPEIGGHFMSFGAATEFGHAGAVFGGLRFGFDGVVQPNLFAHLGAGFVGNSDLGPYTDVGVGVDFQLTRLFSLGLQVAYNTVLDNGSGFGNASWASFGINFGFDFTRPERGRRRYYNAY
jgi:hypothetical protein